MRRAACAIAVIAAASAKQTTYLTVIGKQVFGRTGERLRQEADCAKAGIPVVLPVGKG